MAQIGNSEFPEFTLGESLEVAQRIAREFAGEVTRHGLARALGMSERGGAFAARLGAMRMWGAATGRSLVKVTGDGLRASSPVSPGDAAAARSRLAKSVPLFLEVARRTEARVVDDALLATLVEEVTGAKRREVRSKLAAISRVYGDVRPLLAANPAQPPQDEAHQDGPRDVGANAAGMSSHGSHGVGAEGPRRQPHEFKPPVVPGDLPAGPARVELRLPDGLISLAETVSNIDAMLTVLWAHRQLVAARDAAAGSPAKAAGPDFVLKQGDGAKAAVPHG
jgi:hypothetical protein